MPISIELILLGDVAYVDRQRIIDLLKVYKDQEISTKSFIESFSEIYESNWRKCSKIEKSNLLMTFLIEEDSIGFGVVLYVIYKHVKKLERLYQANQFLKDDEFEKKRKVYQEIIFFYYNLLKKRYPLSEE
nr:hypothetical protein [Navicula tsukamotoi]UXN44534.1 hypothetical protein [Navicula tsukamotoi]